MKSGGQLNSLAEKNHFMVMILPQQNVANQNWQPTYTSAHSPLHLQKILSADLWPVAATFCPEVE